jgi:hypothetical protein
MLNKWTSLSRAKPQRDAEAVLNTSHSLTRTLPEGRACPAPESEP